MALTPGRWIVGNAPGAATVPQVVLPAPASNIAYVVDELHVKLVNNTGAVALQVYGQIFDGAIAVFQYMLAVPAAVAVDTIDVDFGPDGFNIRRGQALTLNTSGAGGAGFTQALWAKGRAI